MKYTLVITLAALAIVGCTPSVRYTRGKPQPPPPRQHSAPPATSAAADDGDFGSAWGPEERVGSDAASDATAVKQPPVKEKRRRKEAVIRPSASHLKQVADSYLGTPYKYGGMSRRGMDCSGFVTLVFREAYDLELPRSSSRMWNIGVSVSVTAARPGDLVFFKTRKGAIDHVGIYMGKNSFIHASTSKGVIYSDLKDDYYSKRFAGVRRVV